MTTRIPQHAASRARRAPVHAARGGAPVVGPSDGVPDERRILAVLGETLRRGRWAVPRRLTVRALLGEVRIDLREVSLPADFTLDVRAIGARVTLVVPPGVSVATDVFVMLGNSSSQADELAADGAARPHVRVRGSAFLGEVRVLVREREDANR